jgi:hypothetical protein
MTLAVRLLSALVLLAWLGLGAPAARADDLTASQVAEKLKRGRALYGEQEYAKAIPLLRAVVDAGAATVAQKVSAFEILGISHLVLGQQRLAREAFENLLALDREHTLSDDTQSPKILRFYEQVKASYVPGYRAGPPVTLEVAAPEGARGGRPLELQVKVSRGVQHVSEVRWFWRPSGTLSYRAELMRRDAPGTYSVRIILPEERSRWSLEYYVEGRDATGQSRARSGDPLRPLSVAVEAAEVQTTTSTPWYRRWWVWTLVGAAVVGGGLAGGLAGRGGEAPAGTLAPVVRLK